MLKIIFSVILLVSSACNFNQPPLGETIQIGTFNIRFFPCNQDGQLMENYNIHMRYPPRGSATDTTALFDMLKTLDIEVLGVEEIVDPPLFGKMAKRHLGKNWEFIYAPSNAWQKVGILYNSDKVELQGKPQIYEQVALGRMDRHRPALRGYFKVKDSGFDFHVIVVHLKSGPRGWEQREEQWNYLSAIVGELKTDKDVFLLGDFNNVSKLEYEEFVPFLKSRHFLWANAETDTATTEYWRPNWKKKRLQGGTIDQIFISPDATDEFIEKSFTVSGYCAANKAEIVGEFPKFYYDISDHCPVFVSVRGYPDND